MIEKLRLWISNPTPSANYLRIFVNDNLINEYSLVNHYLNFEIAYSNSFHISFEIIGSEQQEWPFLSRLESFTNDRGYELFHTMEAWIPPPENENSDVRLPAVSINFPIINKSKFEFSFATEQAHTGNFTIKTNDQFKKYCFIKHPNEIMIKEYKQGVGVIYQNAFNYTSFDLENPRFVLEVLPTIDLLMIRRVMPTLETADYKNKILGVKKINTVNDYNELIQQAIEYTHLYQLGGKLHDQWIATNKYKHEDSRNI